MTGLFIQQVSEKGSVAVVLRGSFLNYSMLCSMSRLNVIVIINAELTHMRSGHPCIISSSNLSLFEISRFSSLSKSTSLPAQASLVHSFIHLKI